MRVHESEVRLFFKTVEKDWAFQKTTQQNI